MSVSSVIRKQMNGTWHLLEVFGAQPIAGLRNVLCAGIPNG
jgi:hypothetical protein